MTDERIAPTEAQVKYNRSDKLRIRCERMLAICPPNESPLRRCLMWTRDALGFKAPEIAWEACGPLMKALKVEHEAAVKTIAPDAFDKMLTCWTEEWKDPS